MTEPAQHQNAVSFLLEQHDQMRRLFDEVERTAGEARQGAFAALVRLLTTHETAEARVVYPALRSLGRDGMSIATRHMQEEDQAKNDLVELERIGPASPDFEVAFKSFRSSVEAHAESEEADVLPQLLQAFDEERLQQMADALRAAQVPRS